MSRKPLVWFYRPSLYWFGWRTLVPFALGSDEWDRLTLVIGWTVTGQIVVPIGRLTEEES